MVPGDAERELILRAVSRDTDAGEELAELALRRLDWNTIFVAALWHKVAFLVYARLQSSGALDLALTKGNLPLLLLNHWKQLLKVNRIRSRIYAEVAVELCGIAEARGVALAVSKGGIALFGTVYTQAERKVYDVDFLGRRDEVRAIEAVFEQAGFRYGEYSHARERIEPPRPGDLRKHLLQGRGLPNLLRKPESDVIDYLVAQVRFRVGSGSTQGNWVPADRLLERTEDRGGLRVVCWPDLALQLALHIHREANEVEYQSWNLDWNLVKLCDFDRIVHHSPAADTVDGLVARAIELGFTAEVSFAARATAALFASPVFDDIIAKCATSAPDPAPLDRSAIQRSIWSVGQRDEAQQGTWVDIVGAKTT